eukprot:g30622.t1
MTETSSADTVTLATPAIAPDIDCDPTVTPATLTMTLADTSNIDYEPGRYPGDTDRDPGNNDRETGHHPGDTERDPGHHPVDTNPLTPNHKLYKYIALRLRDGMVTLNVSADRDHCPRAQSLTGLFPKPAASSPSLSPCPGLWGGPSWSMYSLWPES